MMQQSYVDTQYNWITMERKPSGHAARRHSFAGQIHNFCAANSVPNDQAQL